jgi:hypothetical protein
MNYKEKKRMFAHYTDLGWSVEDINRYATKDLKGSKPVSEEKSEKVEKKDKKSSK